MFKLIKIQNSGVNVPELVKLEKPSDIIIKPGEALLLTDGVVDKCPATVKPTHIAFSYGKYEENSVVVFEISSNMLFEVPVDDDPMSLLIGDKLELAYDGDDCAVFVSAVGANGVATIVDLMGVAYGENKIIVKF